MTKVLTDLLARLEAAEGPDRELDLAIYEGISGKRAIRTRFGPEEAGGLVVRAYTASLDASLALVERVLPGEWWMLLHEALYSNGVTMNPSGWKPLPLALLCALLKALIAAEEADAQPS